MPIDVATLGQLRPAWDGIKLGAGPAVDRDYGVYDGTTFKTGLFADYLGRTGIPWPCTRRPDGSSSTATRSATWPGATRSWSR